MIVECVSTEKPRVRNRASYQEIPKGKEIYLKLEVDALPPPRFQWFRNGYPLADQRQQELHILEAQPGDSGTYSCEVRNIAGAQLWLEATFVVLE